MAMNPMQKKARISFLLGVIITLVITGVIIVLLFLYTNKLRTQIDTLTGDLTNIYVLTQDVKSGHELTEDLVKLKKVDKNTIPADATKTSEVIESWYMQTKDGTMLNRDAEGLYYTQTDESGKETKIRVLKEDSTDNYYITLVQNGRETKQYLEINNVPVVAKLDMKKNTVITPNLVEQSDDVVTNDVRVQDYNVVVLPVDLEDGDYVDIRLMTPNGQDFVVVSKKLVTIPKNSDGTFIADTIRISMREDETLAMSSAIVEAVGIDGSGNVSNPNIVSQSIEELRKRYSSLATSSRRNYLDSTINNSVEYESKAQEGLNNSITNAQEARKNYLDSLEQ